MKKKTKQTFPLGDFLKELRERKGVSLKKVEDDTGISNAYLSQLETGSRQKLPNPDRLKALANYYNVSLQQLLEKAGYFGEGDIEETQEQKIEKTFSHAINDPDFFYGKRINSKDIPLDIKKFINEIYEKNVINRFTPSSSAFCFEGDFEKILRWSISKVNRSVTTDNKKMKQYLKYEVEVTCFESEVIPPERVQERPDIDPSELDKDTNEIISGSSSGKAEITRPFFLPYGHETKVLEEATNQALITALNNLKDTAIDWKKEIFVKDN